MLGTLLMENGLMVPWAGGLCAGDKQVRRCMDFQSMAWLVDRAGAVDIVVAFEAWNSKVTFQLCTILLVGQDS